MSTAIEDALRQAASDAEAAQRELDARAYHAVSLVQARVAADGGKRVIAAGNQLMAIVAQWAGAAQLTPGEAALVLSSAVTGTLASLPGMTADLARAITIEFARGPRSE